AHARYKAAVSVGVSPVFAGEATASCEVHILDFSGDLYGQEIKVEFVEFLRPMIKFESTEALIATVMSNIAYVRENLTL
ncbi:MAG: riboflavin kinase, partial [Raoultibacter sp.]